MDNYIANFDSTKIYARIGSKYRDDVGDLKDASAIALGLAAKDPEGKYRCLGYASANEFPPASPRCQLSRVSYALYNTIDDYRSRTLVESKEDVVKLMNSIKPEGPAIILRKQTNHSTLIYWTKVNERGMISVAKDSFSACTHDIPLPTNGDTILDGVGGEVRYDCTAFWSVEEAVDTIWPIMTNLIDRVKRFCIAAKAADDAELAVGAKRIDQLLKFQSQFKSVEEQISDKWNSMSTEDKAKALKIKKTAPKKTVKKAAPKKTVKKTVKKK